jgi:hypothetical protein
MNFKDDEIEVVIDIEELESRQTPDSGWASLD